MIDLAQELKEIGVTTSSDGLLLVFAGQSPMNKNVVVRELMNSVDKRSLEIEQLEELKQRILEG